MSKPLFCTKTGKPIATPSICLRCRRHCLYAGKRGRHQQEAQRAIARAVESILRLPHERRLQCICYLLELLEKGAGQEILKEINKITQARREKGAW